MKQMIALISGWVCLFWGVFCSFVIFDKINKGIDVPTLIWIYTSVLMTLGVVLILYFIIKEITYED